MKSDLEGLHEIIPPSLRWNAEAGILGYSIYDPAEGERGVEEIELGSPMAKFAFDLDTRSRGYGLVRSGLFDMKLTPANTPFPDFPSDDYKPAIGVWVWNPPLGEVRIETNGTMFRNAVAGILDQTKNCKEAGDGLVPVAQFTDRHKQDYRQLGKSFWGPIIVLCGWLPRAQIAPFAAREPTVPRLAAPAQSQ